MSEERNSKEICIALLSECQEHAQPILAAIGRCKASGHTATTFRLCELIEKHNELLRLAELYRHDESRAEPWWENILDRVIESKNALRLADLSTTEEDDARALIARLIVRTDELVAELITAAQTNFSAIFYGDASILRSLVDVRNAWVHTRSTDDALNMHSIHQYAVELRALEMLATQVLRNIAQL